MTAGLALTAVACGSDKPGTVAGDGSVTVKHAFGETKIPSAPKRVVSAGFTEQDDLLALGVVPIAVTDWFGGEPFGVWPWAQPKLGTAQPVVLNLVDGIQVDQIAALKPDLIVATNAGLDAGHLRQAVRDRADHRAVRPGRVLRTVEGPGQHHRSGGLQVRRDDQARRRRRRQVHRRRQEQPARSTARRSSWSARPSTRTNTTSPRPGGAPSSSPRWASPCPTSVNELREGRPGSGAARQAGLGARRRRRRRLEDRERRRAGRAGRRPDVRRAEVDAAPSGTSSPARNSPARSPSPRCCPTRWWPIGYRR